MVWAVLSSLACIAAEIIMRKMMNVPFLTMYLVVMPIQVVIAFAIQKLNHSTSSYLDTFIVLNLTSMVFRMLASLIFFGDESTNWQTWTAFGLVIVGRMIQIFF